MRYVIHLAAPPVVQHPSTLRWFQINPDGHCMFSAIADQLCQLGMIPAQQANYKLTRAVASDYMLAHPNDFLPFIPSLGGEDGVGATDETGLLTPAQFSKYCATVRDTGAWGGEPEIMALSRAYQVPIHVVQWGSPPIVCHSPTGTEVNPSLPSVKVSYHRRMYGLGEVSHHVCQVITVALTLGHGIALQQLKTQTNLHSRSKPSQRVIVVKGIYYRRMWSGLH